MKKWTPLSIRDSGETLPLNQRFKIIGARKIGYGINDANNIIKEIRIEVQLPAITYTFTKYSFDYYFGQGAFDRSFKGSSVNKNIRLI